MLKEYIKYVLLNILSTLGMSCYIFADTLFISQGIGANGLASLNIAIPGYSLIGATSIMIGIGGSVFYSRNKARNNKKKMSEIFTLSMVLCLIFSLIYMAIGSIFSKTFVRILGANDEIFNMTNIYFKTMFLFAPLFMFSTVLNFFVKNDDNPKLSTIANLVGTFLNIVLDYILIFPFKLGMFGAVLATCMAPLVSILILLFHFKNNKNLKLSKKIYGLRMIMILFTGVPMFFTEIFSGIIIIMFNIIMLKLKGNIGIAAYSILANLAIITTAIYNGIVQGVQPLITRYHALRENKILDKLINYTNRLILIISIFGYIIFYVFNKQIINLFNEYGDIELQKLATQGLKIYFIQLFFIGFNLFKQIKLICVKKVKKAQLISLLRGVLLLAPITIIFVYLWEIKGVWLSVPITEFLVFIFFLEKSKKNAIKIK